jgi:hypothetical protein
LGTFGYDLDDDEYDESQSLNKDFFTEIEYLDDDDDDSIYDILEWY